VEEEGRFSSITGKKGGEAGNKRGGKKSEQDKNDLFLRGGEKGEKKTQQGELREKTERPSAKPRKSNF